MGLWFCDTNGTTFVKECQFRAYEGDYEDFLPATNEAICYVNQEE